MSRRSSERHPKRVEVRFWRGGNPQPHSGFTVDLSRSGLFLGTSVPLSPGERIRLELIDRSHGFMIEGEVARVHRVSLALRHIEQPGVGVRFLTPTELVGSMISKRAAAPKRTNAAREIAPGAAAAEEPRRAAPPAAPPVAPSPNLPSRDELDELFGDAEPREAPPDGAESGAAAAARGSGSDAAPAPLREPKTVLVEFVDRASFLSVYQRDIASGGLFVTTDEPAPLHASVTIELRPPLETSRPLRFEARVVHRAEPSESGNGKGMQGIGVQFFDPDRVCEELAPVLEALRE